MKLRVQGVDYDLREIVQGAAIGDIRDLKKITKGMLDREEGEPAFQGVSPATFGALFTELGERAAEGDLDEAALLSDDSFLLHIQALIWLAKRHDDMQATWDAVAGRVRLDEFSFIPDADDVPAESDPKAGQPDSAPADDQPSQ